MDIIQEPIWLEMMAADKVLFVIPYMHEGGAQRALSNIQAHLPDDYEIDTLVNSETDRVFPNKGNVISLHIDKEAKTDSVVFQAGAFIKRMVWLRRLKKTGNYRVCISFMDSANIANIISGNKHCRVIISVRNTYSEKRTLPQYRYIVIPLARLLYRKADLVVAVSEELRRELERDIHLDPGHLTVITNGYDMDRINELAVKPLPYDISALINGRKMILTAGRLNIQKHQWHLIRAFSKVVKEFPNVVLVIAGTGKLEEYLKKISNDLGISDNILFIGFEDNIYRFMHCADVFVLPSGHEGFPNALGEALCTGAPCIVTDFKTGAREMLAPELLDDKRRIATAIECTYGMITPRCSGNMYQGPEPLEDAEVELANGLIRLLRDDEFNKKCRSKSINAGRRYDIRTAVEKWIGVIEN